MESILTELNPHWTGAFYQALQPRAVFNELLIKIEVEEILVLLGIRRSGKSTLFLLTMNYLMSQKVNPLEIGYINFDDPYFMDMYKEPKKIYDIIQTAEKLTCQKIRYLFLDEIQNVENWEKFVKSVYDSKRFTKIFITGSNSTLLAGQYASLLTGRYLKHRIYPLSFSEMVHLKNIDNRVLLLKNKPSLLRMVDDALQFGTYPKIILTQDDEIKRELLISYYESIIYKDCIQNYEIRNTSVFVKLAHYLLSNPGSHFSYSKLSATFGCSDNTIKDFIHVLEQSYLIKSISQYSISLKSQVRSNKKCYVADNGFIYANAFRFFDATGSLFENLVLTELQKKYGNDIYYYSDPYECDFVIKSKNELIGIQVCYDLNDKCRAREIRGLSNAKDKLNLTQSYIITYDQEESLDDDMHVVAFWSFFSGFSNGVSGEK